MDMRRTKMECLFERHHLIQRLVSYWIVRPIWTITTVMPIMWTSIRSIRCASNRNRYFHHTICRISIEIIRWIKIISTPSRTIFRWCKLIREIIWPMHHRSPNNIRPQGIICNPRRMQFHLLPRISRVVLRHKHWAIQVIMHRLSVHRRHRRLHHSSSTAANCHLDCQRTTIWWIVRPFMRINCKWPVE